MITAIIQARMDSTRLLRKVARLIAGKSMLERVVERVRLIPEVSRIVVATSTDPSDDWIEVQAKEMTVGCFRGSSKDVIWRYAGAAQALRLKLDDLIVRITADCPALDPLVSSEVIRLMIRHGVDYAANVRDWPDGLDTEVFTGGALMDAVHFAADPDDREHVTPWMRRNLFCLELPHDPPLRHLKWSVDTEEELQYVQELYAGLGETFGWEAILRLKPGDVCPSCKEGFPHRVHPLHSIMQEGPTRTVWDLHAKADGTGLLDSDPECRAPALARRASETPPWTICARSLDGGIPRSQGGDPVSPPDGADRSESTSG